MNHLLFLLEIPLRQHLIHMLSEKLHLLSNIIIAISSPRRSLIQRCAIKGLEDLALFLELKLHELISKLLDRIVELVLELLVLLEFLERLLELKIELSEFLQLRSLSVRLFLLYLAHPLKELEYLVLH